MPSHLSTHLMDRQTMALLLAALVVVLAPGVKAISDSLVVAIPGGLVRGSLHGGAVRFMGLPYATARRFGPPILTTERWEGVRNASLPGPQCPQRCPAVIKDLYCLPPGQMSENCLSLNIYRPAYNLPAGQLFPILVFLHPGGFSAGSGAAPLFDGDLLARLGGVIVVTINYRLGAMGFLPIFNGYGDVIAGNLGLRDQQRALAWVTRNALAFNGDSGQVTIAGAEAGCQSAGLHLASPVSRRHFRAAILHSCPFTLPFRNTNESKQMAGAFADALGCAHNDVTCMRGKTVNEILDAQEKVEDEATRAASLRKLQAWGPAVDMRTVHDADLLQELTSPLQADKQDIAGKSVLLGWAAGDGLTDVYRGLPLPASSAFFQRLLQHQLPFRWRQVAETPESPYHADNPRDARAELAKFVKDFVYQCPARRIAKALGAEDGSGGVWVYEFDPSVTWSPGGSAWPAGGEGHCSNGGPACGGLDLAYLFSAPTAVPQNTRQASESLRLATALYWTNFVKHGNPNGVPVPSAAAPPPSRSGQASTSIFSSSPSSSSSSIGSSRGSLLRSMQNQLATLRRTLSRAEAGGNMGPGALSRSLSALMGGDAQARIATQQSRRAQAVAALLSALRRRPSLAAAVLASPNGFVTWPRFSTDSLTSSTSSSRSSSSIMVLTQPATRAKQLSNDDACQFWDIVGFQ